MKKYILIVLLGALFTAMIGVGLESNVETGDSEAFQQALEQDGFTVQKGELGYFDLVGFLEAGVLPSAYGNNPTTRYVAFFVPPASGYEVDERISKLTSLIGLSGKTTPFWNLGPDEAVVFVGRTPPECRYFSYDHYIMHRTYGNEKRWLFANIADPVNNLVIKTEGTPNGSSGNPFNQTTVIVITADRGIDQRIRAAAQSAGYSEDIINTQVLPSVMLNMGLENDSDTFAAFVRPALFNDTQAGDDYIDNTPATVYRITPKKSTKLNPYDYPELRVRGTGQTEFDLMDDLEELRITILKRYSKLNATELPTSQGVPIGSDAIQRGINAVGPNNDACYLWSANQTVSSPTPPFFDTSQYYPFLRDPAITLGNDSDEFIIVYGVNHVATGKATYSNFAIYGADVWNGVRAITDEDFSGSAEKYLPNNPNAKYLYVYKLTRDCKKGDQYCYEVPYGVGVHGIELDQPLFIAWRAYLEKSTKIGPSYSEILYDRAIKFDPMDHEPEVPEISKPTVNPYLASSLYAITHFDSSQSDSTPYGPSDGFFDVDPTKGPVVYSGPINILTLASTNENYMWVVGSDRVSYAYVDDKKWTAVAKYEALADASDDTLQAIPDKNFRAFGKSSAVGMNTTSMDNYLKSLFGENYEYRFGNGVYSVVDKDNVLYTNYGGNLYAFALSDPKKPSAGITKRYMIEDVLTAIQGDNHPANARLFGLSMTYDGHLIITFSNGVAVIDRDLDLDSVSFYRFADTEYVSNSVAVDENNGIYVASDIFMHKLVWNGTDISDVEADGAWSQEYTNSGYELPPIIKIGRGTGSTPTLMGFGDDEDKLVVITDGAKQMNLVAFWRDEIPEGSERVAGQIPVTCGFTTLPEWIQTEQSVVVSGYGAFVVNNIPENVSSDLVGKNKILQVSLMGPAYDASYGAERFEWDPETNEWSSVWARSDVSSTSMVPIHSQSGNMALINGYRSPEGWEILGFDWDTGETVHQTVFGDVNFGNGAYAILQYLDDDDLLFNSFAGPIRIRYGKA